MSAICLPLLGGGRRDLAALGAAPLLLNGQHAAWTSCQVLRPAAPPACSSAVLSGTFDGVHQVLRAALSTTAGSDNTSRWRCNAKINVLIDRVARRQREVDWIGR